LLLGVVLQPFEFHFATWFGYWVWFVFLQYYGSGKNQTGLNFQKDITMNILQRLDTLEIVTSASVVCPLWWNICKDPLIWRTIDLMTNISLIL